MRHGRIESLDLFRGAAAIAVVLYHFEWYLGIPAMEFAVVAVDLFFVLSGIVLGMKYADAIAAGLSFREFASARLRRLYPMVFIAGVFVVALNLLQIPENAYVTATGESAWRMFLVMPVTFSSEGRAFPPDGPVWSLWAELAVNALWFPIMKYRRQWMGPAGVIAVVATCVIAWRLQTLNYGYQAGFVGHLLALVRAFAGFSIGYLIATTRVQPGVPVKVALPLFLGGVAAIVITHHGGWRASLAIVAAGSLLLYALFQAQRDWGPAMSRVGRTLGLISYPLYLIHAPAGRLLPALDPGPLRWLALLGILSVATLLATLANESLVKRVVGRERARQVTAG
jgi:peptidoglycan/LPS O-acetylase OafA/YrhL